MYSGFPPHPLAIPRDNVMHMEQQTDFVFFDTGGRVTFFTRGAEHLLRMRPNELTKRSFSEAFQHVLAHVPDAERRRTELEGFWQGDLEESSMDLFLADAGNYWLRISRFLVRDSFGHWLGFGVFLNKRMGEENILKDGPENWRWLHYQMNMSLTIINACATTLLGETSPGDSHVQQELLRLIDTYTHTLTDTLAVVLKVYLNQYQHCIEKGS